ncbi:MAG: hypothetical protein ACI9EF_003776 [Pseudohongiellaceae bacterium]|jgi:hypothetical protein
MIGSFNTAARTAVAAGFLGLCALAWFQVTDVLDGQRVRELLAREKIAELTGELRLSAEVLAEREAEIEDLGRAMRYLKVDRRRARLTVLEQHRDASDGLVETRVRFTELATDGTPFGPGIEAVLPGRFAYIESLVIKFNDDHVEQGDSWRGASLCLFRRMFTEDQRPEDGLILDPVGVEPLAYGGDGDGSEVAPLWRRFWDYANDPEAAREAGVRAIHGEAPFIELRPDASYLLELRASGGLSLRREEAEQR